jgi:hypothetical protein
VTEEKLSQTLRALEIYDGTYKREYVDAAIEMKEEITPYLIEILEKVLSNPAEYIAREDYHAHIYALMLLGHFGEHRAHKPIVELFSQPGDIPDKLHFNLDFQDLHSTRLLFWTKKGQTVGCKLAKCSYVSYN